MIDLHQVSLSKSSRASIGIFDDEPLDDSQSRFVSPAALIDAVGRQYHGMRICKCCLQDEGVLR
jgi:hypothetical protein